MYPVLQLEYNHRYRKFDLNFQKVINCYVKKISHVAAFLISLTINDAEQK